MVEHASDYLVSTVFSALRKFVDAFFRFFHIVQSDPSKIEVCSCLKCTGLLEFSSPVDQID